MNPRGRKHEKPGGSRFRIGSPLIYLGLVLLGLLLFRNMFQEAGYARVPYSEFKQAIRDGRFKRVQIGPDVLRGYTTDVVGTPARSNDPVTAPWMSTRVDDPELVHLLESKKVEYEAVGGSGLGEAVWIWGLPLLLGFVFWTWMMRRMGAGGLGQGPQSVMSFGKTRARVQAEADTGVGFDDVAGIDEAVDELREIVEFLRTPEKFRKLGGRIPKGVLLVGPPGTGKTLLARAVAGEAGVPFFSLSGSEFVEMFVGVGAARVRDLFSQAQAKAPCIIFIDELDAVGKTRSAGAAGGHDEREQTLNQMLAEMDGFDARAGLIIIAATNRPEILDSALLRPGRFDRQVLVDRPDKRGRERILAIHAREVKLGPDVDLRSIAARTPGFAGADLANVVNEAARRIARWSDRREEEPPHLRAGKGDRRPPRGRTRGGGLAPPEQRAGPQDQHHSPGPLGARLHHVVATRGPVPHVARRAARQDGGDDGWACRRGAVHRRDLDRRIERPQAGDRHRPADGA